MLSCEGKVADMETTNGIEERHRMENGPRLTALAAEAENTEEEREYYTRLRDAWITVANRCEFLDFPYVTRQ